jgi:hypothetical protein
MDQPPLRIGKEQQRKTETDVQIQAPKELRLKRLDCKSYGANKGGTILYNNIFSQGLCPTRTTSRNQDKKKDKST